METLYVPHLPVKFTYQNENLTEGRLNYQKDTIYSRDDLKFRGSRFGYLETNTSSTFKDRDNLILNSDILGLRITDPLNPKGKEFMQKLLIYIRKFSFVIPQETFIIWKAKMQPKKSIYKVSHQICFI